MAYVGCTLPGCQQAQIIAAAKVLHLNFKFIPYDVDSAQSFASAFTQAVQLSPSAVGFVGALPNSLVAKQLTTLQKKKVPVVEAASSASAGGPVSACFDCAPAIGLDGKLMAAIIAADSRKATEIGYVTDPALQKTSFAPAFTAFKNEIDSTIPGSTIDVVDASLDAPAGQNASTVVSYVSSHPNVKYLVFVLWALTPGISQALDQAGLENKVKIVTRLIQQPALAQIKDGTLFAGVASENATTQYRTIDALARLLTGAKLSESYDEVDPAGWHQIVDKADLGDVPKDLEPSGYPNAFIRAWHVSGAH